MVLRVFWWKVLARKVGQNERIFMFFIFFDEQKDANKVKFT